MVLNEHIENFKKFINKHDSFLIVGHKEPDGDSLGSCLAMNELLEKSGKKTVLLSAGPFKRNEIKKYEPFFTDNFLDENNKKNYGLIVLDCASQDRLGEINIKIDDFDTFVIDHHKTSDQTQNSIVIPSSPATTCLVQQLFEAIHGEVTENAAKNLFLGFCTDTGFFRFLEDNSSHYFELASRLVKKGANPKKTYTEMTGGKAFSTRKLLGLALLNSKQYFDGKLIITYENLSDTEKYGENGHDSDALYQMLLSVQDVEAVVNIKQETEDNCTAGLRSKDEIDVSKIASVFGGGGHKNASGLSYKTTIKEFIPLLLKEFEKVF